VRWASNHAKIFVIEMGLTTTSKPKFFVRAP
jgi:hypothetical protein